MYEYCYIENRSEGISEYNYSPFHRYNKETRILEWYVLENDTFDPYSSTTKLEGFVSRSYSDLKKIYDSYEDMLEDVYRYKVRRELVK